MGFNLEDQDNGTLVGLRDMLRKAQQQKVQEVDVDQSSGTVKGYSDGGEVMQQKDRPYTGVPPTQKPDMNAIQQALNAIAKQNTHVSLNVPTPSGKPAPGLTVAKRFADGGEVPDEDPMAFLSNGYMMPSGQAQPPVPPPAPAPMPPAPQAPPLSAVSSSLNQTPDTNYDFFKNLSADDRAALQQKLIDRQNSAPSMIAQGAAGLGDAISNSFGGKNTTFQKDVMANNEAQQAKQMGAFDTHRSQKMQDMNANMEMQANDPKSPLSMSMRKIAQSQGVPVPSGMPASMMMKVLGPLGELAMKQAQLEQTKIFQQGTLANQEEARKIEATKALSGQGIIQRTLHPEVTKQLEQQSGMQGASHGIPDLGDTFNGAKVTKVTRIK